MMIIMSILSEYNLTKRQPEVRIKYGVNDWIQKTVKVSKPDGDAGNVLRYRTVLPAKWTDKGKYEEWKPADYERSGNDGERPGSFTFPRLFALLAVLSVARAALRFTFASFLEGRRAVPRVQVLLRVTVSAASIDSRSGGHPQHGNERRSF